jgi:hypothetical protein
VRSFERTISTFTVLFTIKGVPAGFSPKRLRVRLGAGAARAVCGRTGPFNPNSSSVTGYAAALLQKPSLFPSAIAMP